MRSINGIDLSHFMILSAIIFCIGVCGIFMNRKNIISILISVEIMLLAININFIAFSAYLQDMVGQIFTIFILTVAGAEAAIGLAILVAYFNKKQDIQIQNISTIKG